MTLARQPRRPRTRPGHPDVLVGIDGGGSKTRALVADASGRVLGAGDGGPSNWHVVGRAAAFAALRQSVDAAYVAAGLTQDRPAAAACLGMAGIDDPRDARPLARWLAGQKLARAYRIINDCELLLAAGSEQGCGLALLSGTGSICWGRTEDGRTARAGGWGHLIGDEGSGYALSISALRLAAQTADGRAQAPAVLQAVLANLGLAAPADLLSFVYDRKRAKAELARLAPVVFDLAGTGDAHAQVLVAEAATELARTVGAVAATLAFVRPPLVLGGSLLRRQAGLRASLLTVLGESIGQVTVVDEPALGAIRAAARLRSLVP